MLSQPRLRPLPHLGREHDEIQCECAFDFEPARTAAARLIACIERLGHHALVTAPQRLGQEGLRRLPVGRDQARDHGPMRQHPF